MFIFVNGFLWTDFVFFEFAWNNEWKFCRELKFFSSEEVFCRNISKLLTVMLVTALMTSRWWHLAHDTNDSDISLESKSFSRESQRVIQLYFNRCRRHQQHVTAVTQILFISLPPSSHWVCRNLHVKRALEKPSLFRLWWLLALS